MTDGHFEGPVSPDAAPSGPWPRAPRVTTAEQHLAFNIINQIGDEYSSRIPSDQWVPVRQRTNDMLDSFVVDLLEKYRDDLLKDYEALRKMDPILVQNLEGEPAAFVARKLQADAWDACHREMVKWFEPGYETLMYFPDNPYRGKKN